MSLAAAVRVYRHNHSLIVHQTVCIVGNPRNSLLVFSRPPSNKPVNILPLVEYYDTINSSKNCRSELWQGGPVKLMMVGLTSQHNMILPVESVVYRTRGNGCLCKLFLWWMWWCANNIHEPKNNSDRAQFSREKCGGKTACEILYYHSYCTKIEECYTIVDEKICLTTRRDLDRAWGFKAHPQEFLQTTVLILSASQWHAFLPRHSWRLLQPEFRRLRFPVPPPRVSIRRRVLFKWPSVFSYQSPMEAKKLKQLAFKTHWFDAVQRWRLHPWWRTNWRAKWVEESR